MLNEPRGGHDDDDEPQFLDDNNLNGLKGSSINQVFNFLGIFDPPPLLRGHYN